jgi:hypothetical protein
MRGKFLEVRIDEELAQLEGSKLPVVEAESWFLK